MGLFENTELRPPYSTSNPENPYMSSPAMVGMEKYGPAGFWGGMFLDKDPLGVFSTKKNEAAFEDIRNQIAGVTPYTVPTEAYELMDIYGEAADELLGLQDLSEEATGIAKRQTGLQEAPGMAIAREDIRQSTADTMQKIVQTGGSSTAVMDAIAKAGRTEMDAVKAMSMQNQIYQAQAQKEYRSALSQEAAAKAGLTSSAAQLRGAGTSELLRQKGIEYGYGRETEENLINLDIIEHSNWMAEQEKREAETMSTLNNLLGIGLSLA